MRNVFSALALAAVLCLSNQASAQQLVTNGGFESTLSGWSNPSGEWYPISNVPLAHSGNGIAAMGCVGLACLGTASLSQSLATTSGQTYTFSFWTTNSNGGPGQLRATWAGGEVFNGTINTEGAGSYVQYSFNVVASAASTQIAFYGRNDPATLLLDDVSVQASAVPEPASWAMMIGGFAVAGAAIRRRRKVAALA